MVPDPAGAARSWSTWRRSTPVCSCSATTWRRRSCWPPPPRTAVPPGGRARDRARRRCGRGALHRVHPGHGRASRRSERRRPGRGGSSSTSSATAAFTRDLLARRAVDAGASALVLTVDLPVLGARDTDRRNSLGLPAGLEYANMRGLDPAPDPLPPERRVYNPHLDPTVTWADLDWLASLVDVPVLVKGVLRPDDARRAVDHGADGGRGVQPRRPEPGHGAPRRLTHCPGSSRRWAARCRCWSTAGCVAAPTWPRR